MEEKYIIALGSIFGLLVIVTALGVYKIWQKVRSRNAQRLERRQRRAQQRSGGSTNNINPLKISANKLLLETPNSAPIPPTINNNNESVKNISNNSSKLLSSVNPSPEVTGMSQTGTMTISSKQDAISIPGYLELIEGQDFTIDMRKKLGRGGSSGVYKGRLRSAKKQQIAVKVFHDRSSQIYKDDKNDGSRNQSDPPPKVGEDESKCDFMVELAILHTLSASTSKGHENVVKLYGFCLKPMSIIMKFYDSSLRGRLSDPAFETDPKICLKIALDIASGMAYIHQRGILHLDLKPGNILTEMAKDGKDNNLTTLRCAIGDFGYANFLSSQSRDFVAGFPEPKQQGYTVTHAAPELLDRPFRITRPNQEIHKKIDVFAFSITLYELVFRNNPLWPGTSTIPEIKDMIRSGRRMPFEPTETVDAFGGPDFVLFSLIRDCWCQQQLKRPSFDEIVQRLGCESM